MDTVVPAMYHITVQTKLAVLITVVAGTMARCVAEAKVGKRAMIEIVRAAEPDRKAVPLLLRGLFLCCHEAPDQVSLALQFP
jgi:hypothetical protein